MIDTDKYEGHSPAPWRTGFGSVLCYDKDPDFNMVKITRAICREPYHFDEKNGDWVGYDGHTPAKDGHTPAKDAKIHPDQLLIADAPLLLAEVKRLQKEVRKQSNIVGRINDLVYEGAHKLTWDEFNEILESEEK